MNLRRRPLRGAIQHLMQPHILLVDDETEIRAVVRGLLDAEGYTMVSEAEDGETAIEMIYRERPHIVVLDYMMPRMDGQAVARCARLLSPPSKIIIFTGFLPRRPDWTDCCDAYVDKTHLDGLIEAVHRQARALEAQRSSEASRPPISQRRRSSR